MIVCRNKKCKKIELFLEFFSKLIEYDTKECYNSMYHTIDEVKNMKSVSYKPLFKLLLDREITKAQLREMCGFSTAVATKLNKNEPVSLTILLTVCEKLDCDFNEIIETVTE